MDENKKLLKTMIRMLYCYNFCVLQRSLAHKLSDRVLRKAQPIRRKKFKTHVINHFAILRLALKYDRL